MAYNKFIKNDGSVLLDLTSDTVTVETLPVGVTAHDKYGEPIIGTRQPVAKYDGTVTITSAVIINFVVDGNALQAEDGMTWGQWLSSSYNTVGYQQNTLEGINTVQIFGDGINFYGVAYNDAFVNLTDTIVANRIYDSKSGRHLAGPD